MHYQKMTVKEWIAVEPNPIQRNTEKHLAKAKHLLEPHPSHAFVFAAQLPSGQLLKLDGHTRALAWEREMVVPPVTVFVGIIAVRDRREAEENYKTFDSRDALETMRDKVYGAFHRYGFDPQSGLLQGGNLTYAMRISYGVLKGLGAANGGSGGAGSQTGKVARSVAKTDVYQMISEFSYELAALDGLMVGPGQASAGIVAAFLLSYRRYGHKVTPFWVGVFGNTGSKMSGEMDGIQALCELIIAKKGRYGGSAAADICARALMAVEKWLKDDTLHSIPRPMDVVGYLSGCEKPNERLIKAKDIGKK